MIHCDWETDKLFMIGWKASVSCLLMAKIDSKKESLWCGLWSCGCKFAIELNLIFWIGSADVEKTEIEPPRQVVMD